MKKLYLIIVLAFIYSCNDTESTKTSTVDTNTLVNRDTVQYSTDSMCYMYTAGRNNADTYAVRILIDNKNVSGKMMYLYYEKDWRLGNITGTLNGDVINGVWVYMQEGMKDSINISFRQENDKLVQKRSAFNPETGREYLADSATFSQVYEKIDCSTFPKYDFDLGL